MDHFEQVGKGGRGPSRTDRFGRHDVERTDRISADVELRLYFASEAGEDVGGEYLIVRRRGEVSGLAHGGNRVGTERMCRHRSVT